MKINIRDIKEDKEKYPTPISVVHEHPTSDMIIIQTKDNLLELLKGKDWNFIINKK